MPFKPSSVLLFFAPLLFLTGCMGEMDFEKVNGPMSPGSAAWIIAGGLREQLFPGGKQPYDLCNEEPDACANAGGYKLQVTPSGKVVLRNLKVMLALLVSGEKESNVNFETACQAFAHQLYFENDADAYEVSLRLLTLLTSGRASGLDRALEHFTGLWENRPNYREAVWPTWDETRLLNYAEFVLITRASSYPHGPASIPSVDIEHWARASKRRFFVGNLSWLRSSTHPSVLMTQFRQEFSHFLPNALEPRTP